MKKQKKAGSLNGLGIVVVIILAIIMVVHVYNKTPGETIAIRIGSGLLYCFFAFIGTGLIWLVLFFVVYISSRISEELIVKDSDDKEEPMDLFNKLSNVFTVACFIASYIIVYLNMK